MSTYQIGAAEAIVWAKKIIRKYSGDPNGIDEIKNKMQEMLITIEKEEIIDFSK